MRVQPPNHEPRTLRASPRQGASVTQRLPPLLRQAVSLPFGTSEKGEGVPSEVDGSEEAAAKTKADVFDPFLTCLKCKQQFKYGQIQIYRKHVIDCSGNADT